MTREGEKRYLMREACKNMLASLIGFPFVSRPLRVLSRKGLLPERVWKRLAVKTVFQVAAPDGRTFSYGTTTNDGIGRVLFWKGLRQYEYETIRVFYELAKDADIVLDIGANTGLYALLACTASHESRVMAFEPVPSLYDRLVANIGLNAFGERCQARREVISERQGTVELFVPVGEFPQMASLSPEWSRNLATCVMDVHSTTVDAVVDRESGSIDLVKIDVEGLEDKVLEGMERTIAGSAPHIILECDPGGPHAAVEAFLRPFGYAFYHLTDAGPVEVDGIEPDETKRYRNYLCSSDHGRSAPSALRN